MTYRFSVSSALSNVFWRRSSSSRAVAALVSDSVGSAVDIGGVTPRYCPAESAMAKLVRALVVVGGVESGVLRVC